MICVCTSKWRLRNNCAYKLKESRPARLEAVCPSAMEDRNEESDAALL
jgi:hypothetical protein